MFAGAWLIIVFVLAIYTPTRSMSSTKKIDFDSREEISGLLDALKEDFPLSKQVRVHFDWLRASYLAS